MLALAVLVSPWESGLLPAPVHGLVENAAAAAQLATVQPGQPNACPADWGAVDDTCRIDQPACPYSPFDSSRLMQRSSDFIEFCEETINPGDPDYAACTGPPVPPGDPPQTYPGFAVKVDPISGSCRMLQLRACEIASRIDSDWCRATIRRSWTCTHLPDAIPRNQFNTCYVPPASPVSSAGACGPGSPGFVIVDCADYVGNDLVEPPGSAVCGSYDTGAAPAMAVAANPYWCHFDQSHLKAVCHSATPPVPECVPSTAMCLKRASGTGGCDGIAQVMLCRGLQQKYAEQHAAASADNRLSVAEEQSLRTLAYTVREEGCEPCLILPFEPVPQHCPDDTHETARPFSPRTYRVQMIEQEHDIEIGHPDCTHLNTVRTDLGLTMISPNTGGDCAAVPSPCESPSPGNPVWTSTHFSGVAVVNAPIVVRLHDAPVTFSEYPSPFNLNRLISGDLRFRREYAEFPGTGLAPSGQLFRTFSRPPAYSTNSVSYLGNVSYECVVLDLPLFKLVMEELWPDRPADATAIAALFGSDALDWWIDLGTTPGAQKRITEARGLPWWPDLTSSADQQARVESMKTKYDCHNDQGEQAWCRWTPARSGYYRLKVAGGWQMTLGLARGWNGTASLNRVSRRIMALTPDEQQQILDSLAEIGCRPRQPDPSCAWLPAAVGLENDLSDIIWPGPDPEELYRTPSEQQKYPGLDLRVGYNDFGETGKYTETQEFGIQVHEVRVSTVIPSR